MPGRGEDRRACGMPLPAGKHIALRPGKTGAWQNLMLMLVPGGSPKKPALLHLPALEPSTSTRLSEAVIIEAMQGLEV